MKLRSFLFICFFLNISSVVLCQQKDTVWISGADLYYRGYGFGLILVGVSSPILTAHSHENNLGYLIGISVNYKRYFSRFDFITNVNEAGLSLGYLMYRNSWLTITPMIGYSTLVHNSLRNTTGDAQSVYLNYWGPLITLNNISQGHEWPGAIQLAVGFGLPFPATKEMGFNDSIIRLQLGIGAGIY